MLVLLFLVNASMVHKKQKVREGVGQRLFVSKLGSAPSSPKPTVTVKMWYEMPHSAVPLWNGALAYCQISNPCLDVHQRCGAIWCQHWQQGVVFSNISPAWRTFGPPPAAHWWSTLLPAGRFCLVACRTQNYGLNHRKRQEPPHSKAATASWLYDDP